MLSGNACCAREFWHRRMSLLADAVPLQHLEQGQRENLDVEPEAAMVHVPDVKIELILPRERIPTVDLGPTRYTRLDFVPPTLSRVVVR